MTDDLTTHPSRNESLWIDRAGAAALVDLSARYFDESVRPDLAKGDIRDKPLRFYAPAIVAVWVRQRIAKAKPLRDANADPLLTEGDSPGLERYRNAKADLAEMERDRVRVRLMRVDDLEPSLMQLADVLRGAGDTLARLHGNEAAGVLNEATDEFVRGVEKLLKPIERDAEQPDADPDAPDGDADPDAGAPDAPAVRGAGDRAADRAARRATVSG